MKYSNIFGSALIQNLFPVPSLAQINGPSGKFGLTAKFSEEEIRSAIWSIDSNGRPGPDGFTFGFYKNSWETVKDDVIRMMEEFHQFGKLVKGFNPSFVCLIPKKRYPPKAEGLSSHLPHRQRV